MADSNPVVPQDVVQENSENLKYLEFVQAATLHAVLYFANLYVYAKEKSGPLKPGVETVEGTIKTVVGPVYDKLHDVPIEVLKFVDRKVDESVTEINRYVPPVVKQVSTQAISAAQTAKQVSTQAICAAQTAPVVARSMASDMRTGVIDTALGLAKSIYTKYEPTAKQLYSKYEPAAEQCAVSTWRKLNQLPLFPLVAQAVIPTAANCTEKYNQTVQSTAEKGYRVSSYLPLVPTEKIAKVFSDHAAEYEPLTSSGADAAVPAH